MDSRWKLGGDGSTVAFTLRFCRTVLNSTHSLASVVPAVCAVVRSFKTRRGNYKPRRTAGPW